MDRAARRAARSEAVQEYRAARKALEENGRRDRARGINDETEEYHRLNGRVGETAAKIPWYRR